MLRVLDITSHYTMHVQQYSAQGRRHRAHDIRHCKVDKCASISNGVIVDVAIFLFRHQYVRSAGVFIK